MIGEVNKLASSRKVGMRDINATLSAPISRIKNLRDDEGRRGFTLIELLVVVLIVAILAAIAVPQYQRVVRKSRAVQLVHVVDHISKIRTLHLLAGGSNADGLLNMGFSLPYTGTYTHNTVSGILGPYYNIQYYSTTDYFGVYDGKSAIPIWFSGGQGRDNSWYCRPMGNGGDELCKSITGEKIGGNYLLKR